MSKTVSKLSVELKNAPRDASLVSGYVNKSLNREETLSVSCIVLADNLGEENQPLKRERQDSRVPVYTYVLNMRGQPLMPTTPQKARKLVKEKKAKVIRRIPFTIQLNYPTGENKQKTKLGNDPGYENGGISIITDEKELFVAELSLRMEVSKKLDKRRMYRQNRRSRLWYRPPRFDYRKKSKPTGWLAPSIRNKLDTQIRLIDFTRTILPITEIIAEIASFDIQKMQKPNIQGIEYQRGTLFGYTVRNYLLEKWGHKCAYCGKTNIPLEIDHIIPISKIPNNRIDNLTIACRPCNLKKGNKLTDECNPKLRKRILEIQKKATKSYKGATFMNIVRWKLIEQLDCQYTYGDRTKYQRTKLGLKKSHVNDAFVIAGGTTQTFSKVYEVKQIRRNNRSLQLNRKGFKPSIRKQRYPYQRNDLVKYNNGLYRVKGTHCKGTRVILYPPNQKKKIKSVSIKKIELKTYGKGLSFN